MNYTQEQQKRQMKNKLQNNAELLIQDILNIVNSCQIASGNATGVSNIKGIVEFLDEGNSLMVVGEGKQQKIKDKYELAELLKSIDQSLDITIDRDFSGCF